MDECGWTQGPTRTARDKKGSAGARGGAHTHIHIPLLLLRRWCSVGGSSVSVRACNLRRRRRDPASKAAHNGAGFVSQGRDARFPGLVRALVRLLGPGQEPQALRRHGAPYNQGQRVGKRDEQEVGCVAP